MSDSDQQPAVESVDPPPAASKSVTVTPPSDISTSDLIEGYHVIAEWIRFADAKAAVVLTVGGAVAGPVIPTLQSYLAEDPALHPTPWWTALVACLFSVWLGLLLVAGVWAFLCILPFRKRGRHPALGYCSHFHPVAICSAYGLEESGRFTKDCAEMGDDGLRQEVAACLLIDAHISGIKYQRVSTSIRIMGASAILAILYLIAIQF